MIRQCVDLLVGRAFVPDPLDTTVALARRFSKRPLVAVRMFKEGFEAAAVTFAGGVPAFGPPETFTNGGPEDADAVFLRTFAERHKAKDCLVILTTGYTAVLSSRTRRPESDEEAIHLMRDNPERLLGEPPPQGCRSSIAYHPTHNFAVVFNHKENEINAAVGLAARADLNLVRLQCGMASLLIHIFGNFWPEVEKDAEILFVDRASLFYLPVSDGAFGRPLFDIGLKEAALKQAIAERVGKLKTGGKVTLVDTSGLGVAAMIAERGAGITVSTPLNDQPQPVLWACSTDQPQLGYDLFPNEREVRPFAPARLRPVPLIFWGTLAVSLAVIGFNMVRSTQAGLLTAGVKSQLLMLTDAKKHAESVMHDVQARGKTASAISNWLQISPPTQALLIEITKEIEAATDQGTKENRPVAQVDSIAIARQEGQPQMRIAVVAFGDASAANRVFQRISALFGRKGYSTVDLKESLVPQGFRYEHLLNMPDSIPR
jgi:hypothetical protein